MNNADALRDASPWHPMTKPIDLKHLGKLAEEICEAVGAVCVCLSDGANNVNGAELENEIVDVDVNVRLVITHFRLAYDIPYSPLQNVPDRLVRFGMQLGNAGAAVSRCIIQGIDEREPVTGKLNRQWLEETLGELLAAMPRLLAHLDRNDVTALARMARRRNRKTAHLQQWHGMLEDRK